MARAFEIEDSTAIYSGLLRMTGLLPLQPNMDIRLHILTPEDKRDKALREIQRRYSRCLIVARSINPARSCLIRPLSHSPRCGILLT